MSLRDVQSVLLSMFYDDTILLGHSLESDLRSLKVSVLHYHLYSTLFIACGQGFSIYEGTSIIMVQCTITNLRSDKCYLCTDYKKIIG